MSLINLNSITLFIFVLFVFLNEISANVEITTSDPCYVTDFPRLCRGTIKDQKNVNAATEIAIKELMKRTRQAKQIANKELKREGGIATCLSNFESAFDNLDTALQNIRENDGFSLNINLSAALTDYSTCSDTMKRGQKGNVVYRSAGVLYMMADNCLALSTLVKQ